jgi:hypothetical protein
MLIFALPCTLAYPLPGRGALVAVEVREYGRGFVPPSSYQWHEKRPTDSKKSPLTPVARQRAPWGA